MEWNFQGDQPIYYQIMDQMKTQIATGKLKPGDKIPSVRELAVEAGVNPNTMQKALSELEREGILLSHRTSGRFVAENDANAKGLHQELLLGHIETFLDRMGTLGFSPEETAEVLIKFIKDGGNNNE